MSNDEFGAMTGTKFGEKSEFEKSLGLDTPELIIDEPKPLSKIQEPKFEMVPEVVQKPAPAPVAAAPVVAAPVVAPVVPAAPVKREGPDTAPSGEEYAKTLKDYKTGDIIKGRVVSSGRNIMVDIDYKSEGVIELEEVNPGDKISVGDIIDVFIIKLENKEGHPVLSKKLADYESGWRKAYDAHKEKTSIDVKVISAIKGGLVVDFNGLRGFIPGSQVKKNAGEDIDVLIGQTIPVRVIEIDRRRKKVVFSHRFAASDDQKEASSKIWNEIEAGQVYKGTVTSIKKFGVFVDIGGVEGLVHISELSWKRVEDPTTVCNLNDKVEVFVLGVDPVNKKISLGMKQLQADPWVDVETKYKPGQQVTGRVARLVSFGAFVELRDGLEGLIHISELSNNRIEKPEDVVKPGDLVQARILRVDANEQRIGLSLKTLPTNTDEDQSVNRYQSDQTKQRKEITIGDIIDDATA
ncbi:MAG: 30S ribosomal protein S1 [Candidatus Margulisiibacteriota bacterium]|jgi:4-hydroxy-3-methylbut-2-enyl diphosphate reductase